MGESVLGGIESTPGWRQISQIHKLPSLDLLHNLLDKSGNKEWIAIRDGVESSAGGGLAIAKGTHIDLLEDMDLRQPALAVTVHYVEDDVVSVPTVEE